MEDLLANVSTLASHIPSRDLDQYFYYSLKSQFIQLFRSGIKLTHLSIRGNRKVFRTKEVDYTLCKAHFPQLCAFGLGHVGCGSQDLVEVMQMHRAVNVSTVIRGGLEKLWRRRFPTHPLSSLFYVFIGVIHPIGELFAQEPFLAIECLPETGNAICIS